VLVLSVGLLWLAWVLVVEQVVQHRSGTLWRIWRCVVFVVFKLKEKSDQSGAKGRSAAVSQIPRSAATCNCSSVSERVLSASRSTYQFPGTSVDQNENKSVDFESIDKAHNAYRDF
jgi:hypothetical protein